MRRDKKEIGSLSGRGEVPCSSLRPLRALRETLLAVAAVFVLVPVACERRLGPV